MSINTIHLLRRFAFASGTLVFLGFPQLHAQNRAEECAELLAPAALFDGKLNPVKKTRIDNSDLFPQRERSYDSEKYDSEMRKSSKKKVAKKEKSAVDLSVYDEKEIVAGQELIRIGDRLYVNGVPLTFPFAREVDFYLEILDLNYQALKKSNHSILVLGEGLGNLLPAMVESGIKKVRAVDVIYNPAFLSSKLIQKSRFGLRLQTMLEDFGTDLIANDARSLSSFSKDSQKLILANDLLDGMDKESVTKVLQQVVRVLGDDGTAKMTFVGSEVQSAIEEFKSELLAEVNEGYQVSLDIKETRATGSHGLDIDRRLLVVSKKVLDSVKGEDENHERNSDTSQSISTPSGSTASAVGVVTPESIAPMGQMADIATKTPSQTSPADVRSEARGESVSPNESTLQFTAQLFEREFMVFLKSVSESGDKVGFERLMKSLKNIKTIKEQHEGSYLRMTQFFIHHKEFFVLYLESVNEQIAKNKNSFDFELFSSKESLEDFVRTRSRDLYDLERGEPNVQRINQFNLETGNNEDTRLKVPLKPIPQILRAK